MASPSTRLRLGRDFGWLWAAFAVSAGGTWLAFDAFPLIAILALGAGPAEVSLLAVAGLAVGALVAVPLGPWIEFRAKRRVMVAMDVLRFAAVASVPLAYALGALTFAQLLVVAAVVGAADIAFRAASGACVKALVQPGHLLAANARFESTTWTAAAVGPPLGGALIGVFGPVVTAAVNAVSFLGSAVGLGAIRAREQPVRRATSGRMRGAELVEGWRVIFGDRELRALFANTVLVNALILVTSPLMAVLMVRDLGFEAWQYGLAFGAPCAGGLVGAWLARQLAARHGSRRVMLVAGAARACWPLGLAFVFPGAGGLALVMALQFGLVTSVGIFNPLFATRRLERAPHDRVARVLAAWSISSALTIAGLTASWGVLASVIGVRPAIATAGVLLLATPLLLMPLRAGGWPRAAAGERAWVRRWVT